MVSLAVIFMGQAGSGKSNLCASFGKWLGDNKYSLRIINLDPGVEFIPYKPDLDVRKFFTISDIMKKEKLGPNGAMIRANEKINEISNELIKKVLEEKRDFTLIDLPGQLESFIFRQTGANFVQKLQNQIRTVGIYLIDSELLNSATDFVIATLIATACGLQLPIEVVSILHKSDLIKNQNIIRMVNDFDLLKNKIVEEKKGAIIDLVLPILDHIIEPFARIIKTSSVTNEGMLDLYEIINEIFCACGDIS